MLLAAGYDAAAAALRPRVPAPRRPEDLEVARQRRRSARPHRRVRRRPGALLVRAGDLVRPGRRRRRSTGIHERYERELGNDLGNLLSRTTAMVARYRDGHAALRRRRPTGSWPRRDRATRRRRRRRDSTASTSPARSRRSGRSCAASTGTSRRARPGSSRRTRHARTSSTGSSTTSSTACAPSRSPSSAYVPETAAAILAALRQPADRRLGARRLRRHRARPTGSRRRRRSSRASSTRLRLRGSSDPIDGTMIDTHAHLDGCEEPAAFSSSARARSGVSRIVTIGTGHRVLPGRARDRARRSEGVFAALGIDPHQAGGDEAGRVDELARAARAPAGGRGRRDRTRLLPRPGTARPPSGRSSSAARAGRGGWAARRRSTPATPTTTPPLPSRRFAGTVILHCFSAPALLDGRGRARLLRVLRRQRHLPEGDRAPRGRGCGSGRADPGRDGQPVPLAAAAARQARTSPRNVLHTLAVLAAARGEDVAALEQPDRRATRARRSPCRRREPVAPKKSLGQHFLVDDNILGVIARLAELGADDVVLEIGPGLGVLTGVLADRVRPRPRRRARPRARAAPPRASRPGRTSRSTGATRSRLDLAALRARTDEARRQPAVQRRHADRRREPRRPADASSSGA